MDFDDYQRQAAKTAARVPHSITVPACLHILRASLGVCGEAGELAEIVKKWVFQKHPFDKRAIMKEMGDVLWYLSDLADSIGVSLEGIALYNITKLEERYPKGLFESEHSLNRKEISKDEQV